MTGDNTMNDKTTEAYELRTQLKSARLIIKDQKDRLAAAEKKYKDFHASVEWEGQHIIDGLEATIKAIEPYIRHKKSCRSNSFLSEARCGCGFKELKALLETTT